MENIGVFNSAQDAEAFGFRNLKRVYWNLEAPALYEQSLTRGETKLVQGGALLAETGVHTGRSPKDKFVVRDETTESTVWWDNNGSITPGHFDALLRRLSRPCRGQGAVRAGPLRRRRSGPPRQGPRLHRISPGIRSSSATC